MKGDINPLDESLSDFAELNVVFSEDRTTITLSGVPRVAFLSLLTSAALHHGDHPFKPAYIDPDSQMVDIQIRNAKDNQWWHWEQKDLLGALEAKLKTDGNDRSLRLERKMRRIDPDHYPVTTDVKPAVDPVTKAKTARLKKIDEALKTLNELAYEIRNEK